MHGGGARAKISAGDGKIHLVANPRIGQDEARRQVFVQAVSRSQAGELDVRPAAVQALFDLNETGPSADDLRRSDSEYSILDSIADDYRRNPEAHCADTAAECMLGQWLDQLNRQQREVVEQRYGLHGHGRRTLEEVGRSMCVTRERVRQIQLSALARLRELSSKEGYAEFPVLD